MAEFVGVTGGEAMRVDVPVSLKYVLQHFVSFQHVVYIWNIIYAVAADEGRNRTMRLAVALLTSERKKVIHFLVAIILFEKHHSKVPLSLIFQGFRALLPSTL